MRAKEREANADAVEEQLGTVAPGLYGCCPECQSNYNMEPREFYRAVHEDQTLFDEGSFSWNGCDLCGMPLGADLHAAHASKEVDGKFEATHLDICTDCLMATANGEPYPEEE